MSRTRDRVREKILLCAICAEAVTRAAPDNNTLECSRIQRIQVFCETVSSALVIIIITTASTKYLHLGTVRSLRKGGASGYAAECARAFGAGTSVMVPLYNDIIMSNNTRESGGFRQSLYVPPISPPPRARIRTIIIICSPSHVQQRVCPRAQSIYIII